MPDSHSSPRTSKTRGALTREEVLRAAVRLADEQGIEALSMRKLGQALGVEAMSLYNHVANKEEILDGIVDLVVGEIALPESAPPDWKQAMRKRAITAHEVLLRHPWATMLLLSRANVGPAMLRYVDATIGCLREAGFSFTMADHAWNALDSYIYGFTLQKLNFPFQPEEYAQVAESYIAMIPEAEYPHLHGMTQEIISGNHHGLHELNLGLDLILQGLDFLRDNS